MMMMMDSESQLLGGAAGEEQQPERPYMSFDYRSLLPGGSSGSYNHNANDDEDRTTCGFLPQLSWRERCLGCATCFVAGYLLGLGSIGRVKELLWHGNPLAFIVHATAGNALALAGSCFLSGPVTQFQKMWHPVRRHATVAYLGSLVLTLVVVVGWSASNDNARLPVLRGIILMALLGFQNLAIVWYTLSYVPYGHEAVQSFVRRWWNRNSMEY